MNMEEKQAFNYTSSDMNVEEKHNSDNISEMNMGEKQALGSISEINTEETLDVNMTSIEMNTEETLDVNMTSIEMNTEETLDVNMTCIEMNTEQVVNNTDCKTETAAPDNISEDGEEEEISEDEEEESRPAESKFYIPIEYENIPCPSPLEFRKFDGRGRLLDKLLELRKIRYDHKKIIRCCKTVRSAIASDYNKWKPKKETDKSITGKTNAGKSIARGLISDKSITRKSLPGKSTAEILISDKSITKKSTAGKSTAGKSTTGKSTGKSKAGKSTAEKLKSKKLKTGRSKPGKSVAGKSNTGKSTTKTERPSPQERIFECSFEIIKGEEYHSGLADPRSDIFREKANYFKAELDKHFKRKKFKKIFKMSEILSFDQKGQTSNLVVHFNLYLAEMQDGRRYSTFSMKKKLLDFLSKVILKFTNLEFEKSTIKVEEKCDDRIFLFWNLPSLQFCLEKHLRCLTIAKSYLEQYRLARREVAQKRKKSNRKKKRRMKATNPKGGSMTPSDGVDEGQKSHQVQKQKKTPCKKKIQMKTSYPVPGFMRTSASLDEKHKSFHVYKEEHKLLKNFGSLIPDISTESIPFEIDELAWTDTCDKFLDYQEECTSSFSESLVVESEDLKNRSLAIYKCMKSGVPVTAGELEEFFERSDVLITLELLESHKEIADANEESGDTNGKMIDLNKKLVDLEEQLADWNEAELNVELSDQNEDTLVQPNKKLLEMDGKKLLRGSQGILESDQSRDVKQIETNDKKSELKDEELIESSGGNSEEPTDEESRDEESKKTEHEELEESSNEELEESSNEELEESSNEKLEESSNGKLEESSNEELEESSNEELEESSNEELDESSNEELVKQSDEELEKLKDNGLAKPRDEELIKPSHEALIKEREEESIKEREEELIEQRNEIKVDPTYEKLDEPMNEELTHPNRNKKELVKHNDGEVIEGKVKDISDDKWMIDGNDKKSVDAHRSDNCDLCSNFEKEYLSCLDVDEFLKDYEIEEMLLVLLKQLQNASFKLLKTKRKLVTRVLERKEEVEYRKKYDPAAKKLWNLFEEVLSSDSMKKREGLETISKTLKEQYEEFTKIKLIECEPKLDNMITKEDIETLNLNTCPIM